MAIYTNELEEVFLELREANTKYSIRVLELEKELQATREQFGKGLELSSELVESIYVPYRMGIAVKPNENWKALNNVKKWLEKNKQKDEEK